MRELSRSGRHGEALAAAEMLEAREPRNRDVLYLIAANLRCLNRVLDALEVSQRLERHHLRFSLMVRMRGLEPPLPCGNQNLNLARLPVSPHPHGELSSLRNLVEL